jgi:hypothetical protein
MIEIDMTASSYALHNLLDWVQDISAYADFERFFSAATLAMHTFPRSVREQLNRFAREGNSEGALFLYGFPTDIDLPPTPLQAQEWTYKPTQVSEFWLCCIASILGEPVAYIQEKQGSIFHNIFPTQANAHLLSSESSAIDLNFHTEMAFHPFLPDYLMLYGLRQDVDKEAYTSVTSVAHILKELTSAQRDLLFKPAFKTGIDYSFGSPNGIKGNGPVLSVLYGDWQDPFLRYDSELMIGLTPEAQQVLDQLTEIIAELQQSVQLASGSLLVLDNCRCVHSRSPFTAYYNGRDRWLQRMLVVESLRPSIQDRPSPRKRAISTDFSHCFA